MTEVMGVLALSIKNPFFQEIEEGVLYYIFVDTFKKIEKNKEKNKERKSFACHIAVTCKNYYEVIKLIWRRLYETENDLSFDSYCSNFCLSPI